MCGSGDGDSPVLGATPEALSEPYCNSRHPAMPLALLAALVPWVQQDVSGPALCVLAFLCLFLACALFNRCSC